MLIKIADTHKDFISPQQIKNTEYISYTHSVGPHAKICFELIKMYLGATPLSPASLC